MNWKPNRDNIGGMLIGMVAKWLLDLAAARELRLEAARPEPEPAAPAATETWDEIW